MNPDNITRKEALHRSETISTKSYEVLVDLTGKAPNGTALENPQANFVSTSTARFFSSGQATWIDVIADEIYCASLDGQELDTSSFANNRLPLQLSEGEHELTVTARMRYSRTGEGLHRFVDPADDGVYLYSQFETADARRMYACFEQPNLKAIFKLSVLAPKTWQVFSNSPTPEPIRNDDDFARWDFAPTQRISTYITALVCGDFHVDHGTIRSIKGELPAAVVCRASMAQFLDADRIRQTAQRGFEVYEPAFGREYPFDKYDQLFVPEFNAGAMENAGCVTFRDGYLFRTRVSESAYDSRDNTILHELAHMWFGDLVTMKWWDDLWLNESFAEWSAYFSQTEINKKYGGRNAWTTFANGRKGWAYRQDQLPSTHPIVADMIDLETVDQNFDGITYAKGASVLKQLVAYVGQDNFLAGVRNYFAAHAWANTQFSDLLGALEHSSGRDLSEFASQWLETSGVNTVRPDIQTDENGVITKFEILQSAAEGQRLRIHKIAIGLYDLVDGKLICRDSLPVDVHDQRTPIAVLVGQQRPDMVLLNDQDLDYVKVRFDEQSLKVAIEHLGDIADPMARIMVWSAANDAWRDGELASGQYLDLILRGIRGEDDDTALRYQLSQAQLAVTSYTAPANRVARRAQLVAGLTEYLMHAQPGTDRQLALADALIVAIQSPAGAELLKGWLNGEDVPQGLPIEAERRWLIVTSLARLGSISETEIAAEEQRDQTISGAQSAAGARAALRDAGAKATAWQLATQDPDMPNHTYSAIAGHFWLYGQEELTASYAPKFLAMADQMARSQGIWAKRGHAIRQAALTLLWPHTIADAAWLEQVKQWLAAHPDAPEQVRRVLREQIDVSARALRACELDEKMS